MEDIRRLRDHILGLLTEDRDGGGVAAVEPYAQEVSDLLHLIVGRAQDLSSREKMPPRLDLPSEALEEVKRHGFPDKSPH